MASYTTSSSSAEGHQNTTCYRVEGRVDVAAMCLTKGHLRFDPDHDHPSSSQQQSSGRLSHHHQHFSNSSSNSASIPLNTMQHYTDDLYPLEPLYHHQQQPQQTQQQQSQQQYYSQPQVQQWPEYVPVQRQVPSTRAYSFQPYPSTSPRVAQYGSSASAWDYALLDYPQLGLSYESFGASPVSVPSLCTDSHSFASHGLYAPQYPYGTSYGIYSQQQQQMQMQPQQPTCIAPEDLFARMPLTPISPASLEDSDDRASSPSSASADTNETPLSTNSSPSRPGLQIPTIPSLSLSTSSIAPSWTSSISSNSSLPSPVDSLSSSSSHDDHEAAFVPTASLKKSTAANNSLKAKRATRSAAPEPAWVEAVLAEDAKRLQLDVVGLGSNAGAPRPANRPIAFACVFCRHRKIQCIRPKTEVAPGEKPSPCNQCEKRNRCCEYPPAALNPRIGRRTRPAGSLKNED